MKTIKNYWAIIVGAVLALFGIAVAAKKKHDDKQLDIADKKIDDNKQQAAVISGKVDAIEDQKQDIKKDIKDLKQEVKDLVDKKEQIEIEKPNKTTKQTKENILNKINKRKKK